MISKSLRGDRMGGLVRYLFGPGRAEEHTNQRIVAASDPTWLGTAQPDGATLAQLISELDEPVIVHGEKTRAGYVYHLVVSVPTGDGQLSDGQLSDGQLSDGQLSDGQLSDGQLSDGQLSDGQLSDGQLSDGQLSDGQLSDGQLSDGQLSDGQLSDGQLSDGQLSDGQLSDGQLSDGQLSDGQLSDGQLSDGQLSDGQLSDGQLSDGQLSDGQLSDGQLSDGQLSDGQLSDDRWQRTAQRFADKLGFDEQVQWVAINHGTSTNGNDHIHFVANLIRADDGRVHKLAFDRMRQREACVELEEEFGLTATSPAGMGEGRNLSRREVEQLRSGEVGNVSDLGQHRVATIVRAVAAGARSEGEFVERLRGEGLVLRPRQEKDRPGVITGYAVAERGAHGRLVWYGGGRLGKDLRLPALRTKWGQTEEQRKSAATAWFSDAERRRRAAPENLAGAADAMRQAAGRLQKVPPEDRFSWYIAASESAGVVAAAASVTTDDRTRRELIKAWQAINRATPAATNLGVEVAPGDAAQLRVVDVDAGVSQRPSATWTAPQQARLSDGPGELSVLLGGASRVLMAAQLTDAPTHAAVQTLLVQAVELAAQIARTIAEQQGATAAQRRAVEATERALSVLSSPPRAVGWQFTRSGAEVIAAARQARASGAALEITQPQQPQPEHGVEPPEPSR